MAVIFKPLTFSSLSSVWNVQLCTFNEEVTCNVYWPWVHDHSEYEVYITFIFFSRFFQRSIIYLSSSITYTALTSETDKLAATPSLIPKCCPQNNSTLEFSWWGLTQNSPLVLSTLIFQSWLRYREHFPIPVLWILIRSLLFSGICALIFLWFIGHARRYGSWARVPKI